MPQEIAQKIADTIRRFVSVTNGAPAAKARIPRIWSASTRRPNETMPNATSEAVRDRQRSATGTAAQKMSTNATVTRNEFTAVSILSGPGGPRAGGPRPCLAGLRPSEDEPE